MRSSLVWLGLWAVVYLRQRHQSGNLNVDCSSFLYLTQVFDSIASFKSTRLDNIWEAVEENNELNWGWSLYGHRWGASLILETYSLSFSCVRAVKKSAQKVQVSWFLVLCRTRKERYKLITLNRTWLCLILEIYNHRLKKKGQTQHASWVSTGCNKCLRRPKSL